MFYSHPHTFYTAGNKWFILYFSEEKRLRHEMRGAWANTPCIGQIKSKNYFDVPFRISPETYWSLSQANPTFWTRDLEYSFRTATFPRAGQIRMSEGIVSGSPTLSLFKERYQVLSSQNTRWILDSYQAISPLYCRRKLGWIYVRYTFFLQSLSQSHSWQGVFPWNYSIHE